MSAAFEMQPMQTDLDKAKAIIQKYADMGDANFIQLNELVKGEITYNPELRFVEAVHVLTGDEKALMLRVVDQLRARESPNDNIYPFLESRLLSKSKGGKKRSKKRSNRRSKKNRSRRTTSHRRRSRARR